MSIVINRLKEKDRQFKYLLSNRTVLYDLEPVGIGTAYIESLTSYITRLSAEHNVKLSSLLRNVIAPKIEINYLQNQLLQGSVISKYYLLNGISESSVEFSSTINKLTGRADIQYLTMNNWTGIFSKNITSHKRRWCPECLNQFKKDSKEIYEPLIWYISDIKKCDLHNTSFQEECPKCSKVLPLMHSNLIMGYCQYCHAWLGEGINNKNIESITSDEEFIINNSTFAY
ncbi:TniQ family protein, partial [Robertmurraya massiliosenegalensis]